jgi:outer membrane protein assembly factor BamB
MYRWVFVVMMVLAAVSQAEVWSQFRGVNAAGVGADERPLPAEVGPATNVLWKCPVAEGVSSPVVDGERVYLTMVEEKKLFTVAIDCRTGKEVWRKEAPLRAIEEIHSIGSYAQSSPATDGEVVISFFGSSGLLAYEAKDGALRWYLPMGPFHNNFGAGSSPLLVEDRVILNQDHDTDSFLLVVDKASGETLWRTDRSEFPRSYATPVIWKVGPAKQIVVPGTLRVVGYDWETGQEIWTVRGLSRIVNTSPTVGPEGTLFVPAWAPGGDESDRINLPPFASAIESSDEDKDGTLSETEMPVGAGRQRFNQIDRDKDGKVTSVEYEDMRRVFESARNALIAIRPGGVGDITKTHVVWSQSKQLPYVPSPVYAQGHLFMVKNAGIFSAVDVSTGAIKKSGRVFGKSGYYASPVVGDGKIYLIDDKGQLTVVSAEAEWKVISTADFEDEVHATPAIADGRLYVRTRHELYCFGLE